MRHNGSLLGLTYWRSGNGECQWWRHAHAPRSVNGSDERSGFVVHGDWGRGCMAPELMIPARTKAERRRTIRDRMIPAVALPVGRREEEAVATPTMPRMRPRPAKGSE